MKYIHTIFAHGKFTILCYKLNIDINDSVTETQNRLSNLIPYWQRKWTTNGMLDKGWQSKGEKLIVTAIFHIMLLY